jgi:protein phosphatase
VVTATGTKLPWEAAGATDVGRKRTHNEDVYLMRPELGLFIVCDGMGGHSAGEVAAGIAAKTISEFFDSCQRDPEGTWPFKPDRGLDDVGGRLGVAMRLANRRIREAAEEDARRRNMGTTGVLAFLTANETFIAWAGDSRAYLFHAGAISQVSEDHSLLSDMIRAGKLTPQEIENFPHKNVITRALGPSEIVKPDTKPVEMAVGDVMLLCCDGLHGLVKDDDMAAILAANPDLTTACKVLVDTANANGGTDNITVILVRRTS